MGTALDQTKAPAATTRQANADSFALLVCGWFMRVAVVTDGTMTMVGQADYTRNKYPAPASTKTRMKRVTLPDRRRQPQNRNRHFDAWEAFDRMTARNMQISHL